MGRKEIHEMIKYSTNRGVNHINGSSKKLGRLEFVIGCGKVIFPTGQLIANQISHQFEDGSIDEISGLDFGWWSIWRKRLNNRFVA